MIRSNDTLRGRKDTRGDTGQWQYVYMKLNHFICPTSKEPNSLLLNKKANEENTTHRVKKPCTDASPE